MHSLLAYNTFGIDVSAAQFLENLFICRRTEAAVEAGGGYSTPFLAYVRLAAVTCCLPKITSGVDSPFPH